MQSKKIYFNKAQQFIMHLAPRILYVIASRRFGKSEGIIMPTLLRNIQHMPRGQHAILAKTYKQALTRTLPGTLHALSRMGYTEGIHYFAGRKAPDKSCFKLPYIVPKDWSHYIHWYNGSVSPIVSQDVPYSSNSLTLNTIVVDEAKTINHHKLIDETLPAITPMVYFQNCPWDGSQTYVSDMPTNKSGLWLLDKEKEMDKELISVLQGLIVELYNYKQKSSGSLHYRKRIKILENEIAFFRKEAILFITFSILDNMDVVGESYIKDRYRDLPLNRFLTSIMSYRLKITEGGFYGAISEKHYYSAYDLVFLQKFRKTDGSIDFEAAGKTIFDSSQDTDVDYSQPLYISADSNININWIIVGQPNYAKKTMKTLKSFYVKHPAMLQEVCEIFCAYYQNLPSRKVIFYYDHTFLQGRSANSSESFADTIIRVLRDNDYTVIDVYIGQAMKHAEKHKEIDMGFKNQKNLRPLFNKENNEDLITAMEKTLTYVGPNGWGKDKSEEKLPDSEENPCEHRTDGTDAWDTLYIGCNFFRADHLASGVGSGASWG